MKKSGQALFLILFMLAGSRDSVATDAAGAVQETHKRINLDSTPNSSKKIDPQSKKQPGLFNRCTQYVYNQVTWMQEYYNALDSIDKNTIHVLAILAAVGAMAALHRYAGSSKPEAVQDGEQNTREHAPEDGRQCSIDELEQAERLILSKNYATDKVRKIQSKISKRLNIFDFDDLERYGDHLEAIEKDLIAIPKICRDNYKLADIFRDARTLVNKVVDPKMQLPGGEDSKILNAQQLYAFKLGKYREDFSTSPFKLYKSPFELDKSIDMKPKLQIALEALGNNPNVQTLVQESKVIISKNFDEESTNNEPVDGNFKPYNETNQNEEDYECGIEGLQTLDRTLDKVLILAYKTNKFQKERQQSDKLKDYLEKQRDDARTEMDDARTEMDDARTEMREEIKDLYKKLKAIPEICRYRRYGGLLYCAATIMSMLQDEKR